MKLLIAKLRRMQFGRSSEKVERQIEQLELKLEELEADEVEAAPEEETKPAVKRAFHSEEAAAFAQPSASRGAYPSSR